MAGVSQYRPPAAIMENIKKATAIYTGGNTYIYMASLTDGRHIFTSDANGDEEGFIEYFDTDPTEYELDDVCNSKWYEAHSTESEVNICLWNEMLDWIITNQPKGNYSIYDLKTRLILTVNQELVDKMEEEGMIFDKYGSEPFLLRFNSEDGKVEYFESWEQVDAWL